MSNTIVLYSIFAFISMHFFIYLNRLLVELKRSVLIRLGDISGYSDKLYMWNIPHIY